MLWLLIGYMVLYIHRPFEVWPILGSLRIERIYILFTILYWALASEKRWTRNRLNAAFLGMILALLVSWQSSPYPDLGSVIIEEYAKVAVFYVLVMSSVAGEERLRTLLRGYLFAVGLYMTHSFREYLCGRHVYRMGIARMIGVDTTYNDPNSFAATILYSLPLAFPFWAECKRPRDRLLLLYYTVLSIVCILLTGSRSAMVGLIGLGLLNARKIIKSKKLLMILVIAAPLSWFVLPPSLQNRFLTLIDPSYGPKNARESAEGRALGFQDGVRLWQEQPVTGFGPGSFPKAAGRGYQAHHLYGQVLGELGTLGAFALAAIVLGFWRNHAEIRRLSGLHPSSPDDFPLRLSGSIMVIVMLLLLMGFGGHNLYRYTWMWFAAFQAIGLDCVRSRARAGSGWWASGVGAEGRS